MTTSWMTIEFAKYQSYRGEITAVEAKIDGEQFLVPLNPLNRHYAEIMRQVEAGELTIQEAD